MKRGELYRVRTPRGDARRARVFLVVSRSEFALARYSSVVCVPVYSNAQGLTTEVSITPDDGLKHESWLRCDEVTSVARGLLTDYIGSLSASRMTQVSRALAIALAIEPEDLTQDPR